MSDAKNIDIEAVIKALDACIAEYETPLTSWSDDEAIEWLEDYVQNYPLDVSPQ